MLCLLCKAVLQSGCCTCEQLLDQLDLEGPLPNVFAWLLSILH